jgi:hypothetical protein
MVIFKEKEYESIARFDGGILQFRNLIGGEGNDVFTMTIPITSKKKRMAEFNKDYAKVELIFIKDFARFVIFADDFSEFEVLIRKEYPKEIAKAVQDIINNKLGFELIIK